MLTNVLAQQFLSPIDSFLKTFQLDLPSSLYGHFYWNHDNWSGNCSCTAPSVKRRSHECRTLPGQWAVHWEGLRRRLVEKGFIVVVARSYQFFFFACAEDVAFNTYYADAEYPITKVLRESVYVEVAMLDRTDPNIVLNLGRCWVTAEPSPFSHPQWDLLIDG